MPRFPGDAADARGRGVVYRETGRVIELDECAQMRAYQRRVLDFWREHPGEKARLAAQATVMLASPRGTQATGRPGAGTWLDTARDWALPLYMVVLYVGAALGVALLPRRFVVLAVGLLGYQLLAAMVFAGATRYRVPWDFLLALLAAGALTELLTRRKRIE